MTVIEHLRQGQTPTDRPALIEVPGNRTISHGELWEKVERLAQALCNLGLEPGDRVMLVLPNNITWAISFLAVLETGAIAVPLRQSATSTDLKRLVRHARPCLFISDGSFVNRSLPFDLLDKRDQAIICTKAFMARSRVARRRIHLIDDLLKRKYTGRWKFRFSNSESSVASINYTYRGYGYPLGAMLTHGNYVSGITAYVQTAGLHAGQRFLASLPFSHVYPLVGCLLAPLATKSTAIVTRSPLVHNIYEAIRQHHPDVLTGVPAFYSRLLQWTNSMGVSLKPEIEQAMCGGSLLPLPLYEQIRLHWGIALRQGYGLTECLPVTCNPSRENRPETLGKVAAVPGISVRIYGENSQEQPAGQVGEIAISGPTVMAGYYSMRRETSETMRNGWFYTGDMGWFDGQGYLHFIGVKKRIAKIAGNMVDLSEVEREILNYPGVLKARVYSVQGEKGEVLQADIVCQDNALDTKTIRQNLRRRLTSYKVPSIKMTSA